MAVAFGGGQGVLLSEDEAHAWHTFQALAGGSDQGFERHFAGIDRQGAEGTHGIDDQAFAVAFDHLGDLRQRVEDAGAGFAVDQRHVGDGGVGGQQAVDIGSGGRLVFGSLEGAVGTAQDLADLRQALAIGTVDQYQDLAIARYQGADGRFHGEGATALQRDAVVGGVAVDDGQQLFAQAGGQLVEVAVPGAPVHQHGLAGAGRGGQWAGGQQDRGVAHSVIPHKRWAETTGPKLQFAAPSIKLFVVMPAISQTDRYEPVPAACLRCGGP